MNMNEKTPRNNLETSKGLLAQNRVRISKKEAVDELSSRGYGVVEKKQLVLNFCEALYLMEKQILEIEDEKGDQEDFQSLVQRYESVDENALASYLVYRDLRSRGYVVREGFGSQVEFRVYDRGDYSKDTAKYLIISVQEGKPVPIEDMTKSLTESLSLKKELILAVINRRGEIVYYSVGEMTLE